MRAGADVPLTIRFSSRMRIAWVMGLVVVVVTAVATGEWWRVAAPVVITTLWLPVRVEARPDGLYVRNVYSSRLVPWSQVHGFTIKTTVLTKAVHVHTPETRPLPLDATRRSVLFPAGHGRLEDNLRRLRDVASAQGHGASHHDDGRHGEQGRR